MKRLETFSEQSHLEARSCSVATATEHEYCICYFVCYVMLPIIDSLYGVSMPRREPVSQAGSRSRQLTSPLDGHAAERVWACVGCAACLPVSHVALGTTQRITPT